MYSRARKYAIFTAFLSAATLLHAADMPSGASLVQRYIDRSGGAQAWAKAGNMTMSGTVEMAGQNISGTVTIAQQGEKSYTVMEFAGIGKIEEGYDGTTAWQNSALQGPRILEGDEKVEVKRASTLSRITDWRQVYKEARTIGSDDLDGKPVWKVEMVAKEGKPETFYFEKDSGLLVRITGVHTTELGDIASDAVMSDFRAVDGILTPFAQTEKAMNQTIMLHFNKVSYNDSLPPGRFDLPADIKALAAKKK
ncbi:MAG TPA: hypothetical protein VHY84_18125 [Bryobacteraceae bacterium]|jgi:hypothetical protein|nr:hypothetical protein [Bryobacteraceae bacterium]